MPLLKRVTGAKYGADVLSYLNGSDTADTLRALSGTGLAFVASTDFDFETSALGYVTVTKGNSLTFRLNNQTEFLTAAYDGSTDHSDYWLSFWIRGAVLAGEAPPTNQSSNVYQQAGTSNVTYFLQTNSTDATEGFGLLGTSNASGQVPTRMQLVGANSNLAALAWNRWHKLTLHMRRGASSSAAGLQGFYVNGRLVCEVAGFDGTGGASSQLGYGQGTEKPFTLPAWSNVQWQLAGPIEAYNGRDLDLRPDYVRNGTNRPVAKDLCGLYAASGALPTQGRDWAASGSGAVTGTNFAVSGTSPLHARLVFSGNGNTPVATSIENLGGPYYRDGWQTVCLSNVLVCGGTTLKVELLDTTNTSAVLTLNVSGGKLKQDSTDLLDWAMPAVSGNNQTRYSLFVHLGAAGTGAVTLFNHTVDKSTTQAVFSANLASGWTPQTLGRIRLTATTTANNVEVGPVGIGYEFSVATLDSLSSTRTYVSAPTPASTVHNALFSAQGSVPSGLPYFEDRQNIPGGVFAQFQYATHKNLSWCPGGQTGLRRSQWETYVRPYLDKARNLQLICADLGSINDIATISGNGPTIAAQIVSQLKSLVDTVVPNGNRVWIATMLTRDKSGQATFNSEKLAAIETANNLLRAQIASWNTTGRILFSDIALDYQQNRAEYPAGDAMWTDDTHPSAAGYQAIGRRMWQIARVPSPSQRNRVVATNRRLATALLGR
jgi:lysophospholipase L1-like esterase